MLYGIRIQVAVSYFTWLLDLRGLGSHVKLLMLRNNVKQTDRQGCDDILTGPNREVHEWCRSDIEIC